MVREASVRIDFAALRALRRGRLFDAMETNNLDICIFGREANARYAAGTRRLWTSNTRPFVPKCVAVRKTGRVHLLTTSTSAADAPPEIPFEDLFASSFDPERSRRTLESIPGLPEAERVGVDGSSMAARALLSRVCPSAKIRPVEAMVRTLRRRKFPAEIECIKIALLIAQSSLQAAGEALAPGRSGRELQSRYLERMCQLGTSTFAQQGIFGPITSGPRPPWETTTASLKAGDSVVLGGGVLWAGYEGSLARTWRCPDRSRSDSGPNELYRRWQELIDRLIENCRAGRNGADLLAAYQKVTGAPPSAPIAYGIGLGHEGPIAGSSGGGELDRRQELLPGMVVALRGWITEGNDGFLAEEIVEITTERAVRLTSMGHGPLA